MSPDTTGSDTGSDTVGSEPPVDEDSVAVLEYEDRGILDVFAELDSTVSSSITDRAAHGYACKHLVRRLAIREAAKTDIVEHLADVEGLADTLTRIEGSSEERRRAIDRVDKMTRGITAMDLNQGQDIDAAVDSVRQIVEAEITWELEAGIPSVRRTVGSGDRSQLLRTGRYLRGHAPTHPGVGKGRWYERSGILVALKSAIDHLRDRPRPIYTKDQAE